MNNRGINPNPTQDEFIDIKELAKRLNISRSLIFRLMASGTLPFLKIGKTTRFLYSDVVTSIRQSQASTGSQKV
ncbi:MAG: helix-turn-helix transcriptional regulator [Pseudobdellovibrionaceae bacterium]